MPLPQPEEKKCLGKQFAAPWMTGEWTLRERLAALAQFQTIFEQQGLEFSELIPPRRDGALTTFGAFAHTKCSIPFQ